MYGLKYWWIFACANTSWWMITERKWWMWPGQTSFPDNCPLIIETHHFTFLCTERTYKTSQYQHYPRQRIHMYGFFLPCHLQDIISLTREREWERLVTYIISWSRRLSLERIYIVKWAFCQRKLKEIDKLGFFFLVVFITNIFGGFLHLNESFWY